MPGVLDCATTACDIINIGSLVKLDGFRIPFTILEYSYIDDRMVSLVLYSGEEGIRYHFTRRRTQVRCSTCDMHRPYHIEEKISYR